MVLVFFLSKLLNKLFSGFIFGKLNSLLGGVLGGLKGVVFAAVFCLLRKSILLWGGPFDLGAHAAVDADAFGVEFCLVVGHNAAGAVFV